MIKFLVVDHIPSAVPYAQERGWTQLGYARYATPERDDVRVVARMVELFSLSGGMPLVKGPGFNENRQAEDFEKLVEDGAGRWVE